MTKTICEFESVTALGAPCEIKFTIDTLTKQKFLEVVMTGNGFRTTESIVKLPDNFQRRLAVHNLGTD